MKLYVIITIVAFIILIIGSVYGWYKAYLKEELKLTKLKESNGILMQKNIELQKRIIELERYKPRLPILLDGDDDND